jgi:LemA protein
MTLGLAALVLVLAGLFVASLYNGLFRLRNGADGAFGFIDVQLKQRCDLIPQVVDAVRGYMAHEQGVLAQLTELRTRATAAQTARRKQATACYRFSIATA